MNKRGGTYGKKVSRSVRNGSNNGSTHSESRLFMNKALRKIADSVIETCSREVKDKRYRYKESSCLLTDEQVRQARIMYEQEGKSCKVIAAFFGLEPTYMTRLLNYQTRSKIFP